MIAHFNELFGGPDAHVVFDKLVPAVDKTATPAAADGNTSDY